MSKTDIINIIAKQRMVERIVKKYDIEFKDDLSQMIYLWLLEKPDELIQQLWNHKQINFYVANMVRTQVVSVTSKYYNDYVKRGATLNEAIEVPIPEKYTLIDEMMDKIDNLSNEERDMLYASMEVEAEEREEVRKKLGITKWKYQDRLKKLRRRICSELGGNLKDLENYYSHRKKVSITDTQHNQLIFKNFNEAAEYLNIDPSCVRLYCGRRCYHNGYYFKYVYD